MWITNSVAVQGRGHLAELIPCQDKVCTLEQNEMAIIALADGAGSCSLSHFGAETVCRTVTNFFQGHAKELYSAENPETLKILLYQELLAALEETAQAHDCKSVKELSSTLLCAVVYKDKLFTVHIGDGMMVIRTDGTLSIFSEPDNGEYANQTTFVTSSTALEHMRISCTKLSSKTDAVFLMSDGSAASLYHSTEKKPSNSLNLFADMSMQYSQDIIQEELTDFFENSIRKRTLDDCSLCMLVKTQHHKQVPNPETLRRNLRKILEYLQENNAVSIQKLASVLYRKKHLKKVKRDVNQLAEYGYLKYEQGTIYLLSSIFRRNT